MIFPVLYCSIFGLHPTGLQVLKLPRDSNRDINDLLDKENLHKGSWSNTPLCTAQGEQEEHGIDRKSVV